MLFTLPNLKKRHKCKIRLSIFKKKLSNFFPIKPKVAAHFEQFIQANHSTFLQVQWFSQKA